MADNYVALRLKATDDAKPDLTDLKLRLDELKGKVAEARAKVDTTEADLPLARLAAKLEAVGKQIARPRVDMAGGARAVAELEAVDVAMRKTGDEAGIMAAKTRLAGANAAKGIGLFAGASAALSLAGPFAAAGLAAVAFGAVAIPVLHKVAAAHTALAKAQQQYANATTGAQRTAALKAEAAATAGLTDQQKGLMGQVGQLQKSWNGLEAAMTPVIVQVAGVALKLGQALLPAMDKLVPTGAKLLDAVIGPLTKLVSSPFFDQFIGQMTKMAGQMGGLLGPQLVKLIELFMQLFMQAGPAGVRILSVLLPLIIQLAGDLVPVITVVANVVASVLEWLQKTHLLIPLLAVLAVVILAMEAPITAIIIAIALLVAAGVELGKHWHQIWHAIAHGFDEARHFIAHVLADIRHDIARWIDDARHAVASGFDWIRGHIHAAWSAIVNTITGFIGKLIGAERNGIDRIVSFFKSLPGRILHALGDLGHLLWNAGVSILKGLLGGLVQQFDDVKNFVGGIGSWIASHKGPIEVDAVLLRPHGRAIMGGLVGGLQDGMPGLSGQLARTTAAITGGVRGGARGGFGGGGRLELVLTVEKSGDPLIDEILHGIRGKVRVLGGDPDMFTKKVAFR